MGSCQKIIKCCNPSGWTHMRHVMCSNIMLDNLGNNFVLYGGLLMTLGFLAIHVDVHRAMSLSLFFQLQIEYMWRQIMMPSFQRQGWNFGEPRTLP